MISKQASGRDRVSVRGWGVGTVVVGLAVFVLPGCGPRQITFVQDEYINTAVHCDREVKDRTGEPLELAIVCVYPADLKNEANHGLRREARMTSQEWYKNRPIPGDKPDAEESHPRFRLPRERVYLLTNESESNVYGTRIGPALNGAKIDGATKIIKANIEFDSWVLHDRQSVIYVFGRFKDEVGSVLPVPPAMFDPPGAYTRDIQLKMGVKKSSPADDECSKGSTKGQYIENITERKLMKDMRSEG